MAITIGVAAHEVFGRVGVVGGGLRIIHASISSASPDAEDARRKPILDPDLLGAEEAGEGANEGISHISFFPSPTTSSGDRGCTLIIVLPR
jgi:hypothetical protein